MLDHGSIIWKVSHMTIFFPLLLLAATENTDLLPPRIEALRREQSEDGTSCIADRSWCVEINAKGELHASNGGLHAGESSYPLTLLSQDEEGTSTLWPHAIVFGDGMLAGIETEIVTSYSGGGGQASKLHLILFHPGRMAMHVLTVPIKANIIIRACFSKTDMEQRAGACHDEYNFKGRLSLDGRMEADIPILHYITEATSYPGSVSRDEDSLENPPLGKGDLITVTDSKCSFERFFRFRPAMDGYRSDEPLPDCSNYTVP